MPKTQLQTRLLRQGAQIGWLDILPLPHYHLRQVAATAVSVPREGNAVWQLCQNELPNSSKCPALWESWENAFNHCSHAKAVNVTLRTAHSGEKKVADETCLDKRDASVVSDDKCKHILTAGWMKGGNSLRIWPPYLVSAVEWMSENRLDSNPLIIAEIASLPCQGTKSGLIIQDVTWMVRSHTL